MCVRVNNQAALLSKFGAKDKDEMVKSIDKSAPSLVEYFLKETIEFDCEDIYLPFNQIQETIHINESIQVQIDYDNELYIIDNSANVEELTGSFN